MHKLFTVITSNFVDSLAKNRNLYLKGVYPLLIRFHDPKSK